MTNEEAITELTEFVHLRTSFLEPTFVSVAVEALKNIDRITAERDALMKDLKKVPLCHCCKYDSSGNDEVCLACLINASRWEWRGLNRIDSI